MDSFAPRKYQIDAFQKTMDYCEHDMSSLVIMATGTGKTHVMGMLCEVFIERGERILILAHNGILLDQADSKISMHTGIFPEREQGKLRSGLTAKIVTGSVLSMQRDRLLRFPKDHFDKIIIDEAHRSVANSYLNVFDHFHKATRIGFTATADRPDGKSLSTLYDAVSYEYNITQAIRAGFLCPIVGRKVKSFTMDLDGMRLRGGDFDPEEIERIIEEHIVPIAENIISETEDRKKVLVFLPDVKSSELMAEVINGLGHSAGVVSGKQHERINKNHLQDFHDGTHKYMCCCQKLVEGYDEPGIDVIVMLRPTLSRIVYSQAVGRGTRLAEGKKDLLLLEFTFNSSKHKLVSAFELVGGIYDERVVAEAEKLAEEAGGDLEVLDFMDAANDSFYSVDNIIRRANTDRFDFVSFDPLGLGDLLRTDLHSQTDVWFNGRRLTGVATPKQKNILERFMVDTNGLKKDEASTLINALMESKGTYLYKGPASEKQVEFLNTLIGPEIPKNMTKAMASLIIQKKEEELWDKP